MNERILQNINGKAIVKTSFRGREIIIKPKCSYVVDIDDEEGKALYRHLLGTYKFVIDRTIIYKKESKEESPVKTKQGFHQELIKFIESNVPREYLKRIIYTDDSITVTFGKGNYETVQKRDSD